MRKEITVPEVGESVSKGMLTAWLKQNSEQVKEGEDLFELETDKATLAVPSPVSGTLFIGVQEGNEVAVGQVIAYIETDLETGEKSGETGGTQAIETVRSGGVARQTLGPGALPAVEPAAERPAGPELQALERQQRVKMTAIRRRTAERLLQAKLGAAHLTTFNEVNMARVLDIRKVHGQSFEVRHGVKLGLMSYFVKACIHALKAYPEVNAQIDGDDIIYNNFYNIGIAVSTERGLLVPVVRDAERLSFAEIERQIRSFAERAREKKLLPDELIGGTFSITNGGVFGSLLSTPIPNPPQTAILGMHVIQNRPVALGDQAVIQPMMYVALTYDHRVIDGSEAVGFLVKVKHLVEDPQRLLLEL